MSRSMPSLTDLDRSAARIAEANARFGRSFRDWLAVVGPELANAQEALSIDGSHVSRFGLWVEECTPFSRSRAYEIIQAHQLVSLLSGIPDRRAPENLEQVRALGCVATDDLPQVWEEIVNDATDKPLTAALIRRHTDRYSGRFERRIEDSAEDDAAIVKRANNAKAATDLVCDDAFNVLPDATGEQLERLAKRPPRDQIRIAEAVMRGEDLDHALEHGPPKCPNCAGQKWAEDDRGTWCAKCHHPHGEPTGGADEDRISTQRSKTVKTVEALMRAVDDLHLLLPRPKEHSESIDMCKAMLKTAKGWK